MALLRHKPVVYITLTGVTGTIVQGVQQPFEISVMTSYNDRWEISLKYMVYPNPTTDNLILKVKNAESLNLSFQLYDINGRLLKSNKITGDKTNINVNDLIPSEYFLKVIDQKDKEIKTFKIIKN